jgi:hypothetical protein
VLYNVLASGRTSRTWAQDALANCNHLSGKLLAIRSRWPAEHEQTSPSDPLDVEGQARCRAVAELIEKAESAAHGKHPRYQPVVSPFSGNCVEAAFRNAHYAEAALARLYSPAEIRAALPEAVRRVDAALEINDPTRKRALSLLEPGTCDACGQERRSHPSFPADEDTAPCSAEELSEIIAIGHEASDRHRARLRVFRNLIIIATFVTSLLMVGFLLLVARNPSWFPLCYEQEVAKVATPAFACPTAEGELGVTGRARPSGGDIAAVAVMGLLGGSLSAGVFIRGLYVNSTPYNVSIPLALLKLPAGATAAVVGLLLLAGDFVPGFTAVDRQHQILAYAVVFGFGQQLFTKMLDARAEELLANVPTKARVASTSAPSERIT